MAEITFDGRKVDVAPGTNLVEAGLKAGVPVPVFCYHKDLGAVGSCRVCACTVKGTDGKARTVMACMTAAQDGMEVTTLDSESVALRRSVIEWLMINHPHDCPICDEGGECQLQDLTIAGGHGQRHVTTLKRTFQNQFLGEFIQHEMNRCIACYRCSRFYQEYAGGRDFGVTGSRDRVYFGRFEDGAFESPFSGNLVEMCPTGVFTDKLFRYKSRVWDLEIVPSVCPHCSVGCSVLPGSRHRELQRVRVRENPAVNGAFMCDRGQFGHGYVMDPTRPRSLRANGESMGWEDAIGLAGGELLSLARQHGPSSIALVASARASLETHAALDSLAQGQLAGARVAHFDDPAREARALAALAALGTAKLPPLDGAELATCDVLLVAGASLVDEAPIAALAARQVARRGGRVFVLNAGERYLNDVAHVIPVHPARLAHELQAIAARLAGGADGDATGAIAQALGAAKHPAILMGSDLVDGAALAAGTALASALAARGKAPAFGCLFPGPNAFGAALLSREAGCAAFLADLAAGKLKAVVLVECETSAWESRHLEALARLDLRLVLDYLPGPLHEAASIFLPTTTTYESSGIYVNRAGRAQAFVPDRAPGISVGEQIQNGSFPRTYRIAPPAGDARQAWQALELLRAAALGAPEARALHELRGALLRSSPQWSPLRELVSGGEGVMLDPALAPRSDACLPDFAPANAGLSVFRMDRTLGSEVLSRHSAVMRKAAGAPVAMLSPADAERFAADGRIAVTLADVTIVYAARAQQGIPDGVLLVPWDAEWPAAFPQGSEARVATPATA